MTVVEDFQPCELGFDEGRFPRWRAFQYNLVMDSVDCQTRFSGHCAPCGTGKSLALVAYAKLQGGRTLILTPYKGLQDQMRGEFSFVTDVRGANAYHCPLLHTNCDLAAPRCEARASVMGNSLCDHRAAHQQAANASVVVTNYSCWMHQVYGQGWGEFDSLICDEADVCESAISDFLSFQITAKEALGDLKYARAPHWVDHIRLWVEWARNSSGTLRSMAKLAEDKAKESDSKEVLEHHFHLRSLSRKIQMLSTLRSDEWVAEQTKDGIKFDPIWPGRFAEAYLFRGIKRVLLYSGTLNEKTFDLFGVKKDDYTFYEYPSPFHPARNPLILVPVGDFKYPIKDELIDKAVKTFDSLVDRRMDRKGMLQTISFKHLDQFMQASRHAKEFVANDIKYVGGSRRTNDVVDTFKKAAPPAILASPSVTAGYDFPDSQCRFQAILKVPFSDTTSEVEKARKKLDPEYHDNQAMTRIIQMSARPCRSEKDWNENLIFDTRILWFLKRKKHLATKWFLESHGYRRFRMLYEGVSPEPMKG